MMTRRLALGEPEGRGGDDVMDERDDLPPSDP